jgi:hypothetical protein
VVRGFDSYAEVPGTYLGLDIRHLDLECSQYPQTYEYAATVTDAGPIPSSLWINYLSVIQRFDAVHSEGY